MIETMDVIIMVVATCIDAVFLMHCIITYRAIIVCLKRLEMNRTNVFAIIDMTCDFLALDAGRLGLLRARGGLHFVHVWLRRGFACCDSRVDPVMNIYHVHFESDGTPRGGMSGRRTEKIAVASMEDVLP